MKAKRHLATIILLVICSLATATPTYAYAAELTMGEAINKAGRQRMLTQRIVKAYSLMGQDVRYRVAKKQLHVAISLFEKQLNELKTLPVNASVTEELNHVTELWEPVKQIATGKVDRKMAPQLRNKSEELLKRAHEVVLLLEASSGTNAGHLVNIAGRQRMLTQRMANLYLLQSWGFTDPQYQADYQQAIEEFSSALKELQAARENTPEINAGLKEVSQNWEVFKMSGKMRDGNYIPALVVRSLDKILVKMNEITGQYAVLLK